MGQKDNVSNEDIEKAFDELVWELQGITGMTKRQVLTQIYPDEIDYILKREQEHQKQQELERLQGYLNEFLANSTGKGVKKYKNNLIDRIEELENDQKEEKPDKKIESEEDLDRELNKLGNLKSKMVGKIEHFYSCCCVE